MTRILSLTAALAMLAAPAMADSTSGTIVAFDRVAQIIVMEDRSIWTLNDHNITAPEGLEAGMNITITFSAQGDSGYGAVQSITVNE